MKQTEKERQLLALQEARDRLALIQSNLEKLNSIIFNGRCPLCKDFTCGDCPLVGEYGCINHKGHTPKKSILNRFSKHIDAMVDACNEASELLSVKEASLLGLKK